MYNRSMKCLLVLMCAVLVTSIALPAIGDTAEKNVVIRYASNVSESEIEGNDTPMAVGINAWIKTVEEASNGSIKVELFPGSQLASGATATIGGVQGGAFEMAQYSTGAWGEYTDAFSALNVPFLFSRASQVHAVMDGAYGELMFNKLREDANVEPLCYVDIGFRNITNSNKTIKTPDDIKGLKLRTMTDSVQIAAMKDLGANVTPLPVSELFSALQQRLVDAQENPLTTIYTQKYYEVQKYCTLTRHSYTTTIFFMNRNFFNSLSDNQKLAVQKANEAARDQSRAVLETVDEKYAKLLEEMGMEIYTPTDEELKAFQEAVQPTWETVKATVGDDNWALLVDTVNNAE